ncbi:hypothetical protein GO730_33605 [Spirosoma sp. HMF3257]|uniref:hypothetical protein n=1 Tax=Spirosoma telluris TaxID=2183553 RepID=UPI0011B9434F|nr:hypothetical protein [Spirosoma telluris]
MRSTFTLILGCLAVFFLPIGCTKLTPLQPPTNELEGTWVGTYKSKQISSVPTDQTPVSATATFQVSNQSLVASIFFTVHNILGPPLVSPDPTQFTGRLIDHQISMHRPDGSVCDQTQYRYVLYLNGLVKGDTLTLVGQDTICPVKDFIFQRALRLVRQ